MNDKPNEVKAVQTKGAELEEAFGKLDVICSGASGLMMGGAKTLSDGLKLAQAVSQMRAILTPAVMAPIMDLMNTELGFKTDRDPKKPDKNGKYPTPYAYETVKECFIVASLRGLRPVNNEWNIIAHNTYTARNGLKRQCEEFKGVSVLKVDFGLPRNSEKGAVVPVSSTWKLGGVDDGIKAEIPVKVNEFQGADAILGKAERKIYKRILDRLTGTNNPDGDADDAAPFVDVEATVKKEPQFTPAPKKEPEPVGVHIRVYKLLNAGDVTEEQILAVLKRRKICAPEIEELAQLQEGTLAQLEQDWDMVSSQARIDAKAGRPTVKVGEEGTLV